MHCLHCRFKCHKDSQLHIKQSGGLNCITYLRLSTTQFEDIFYFGDRRRFLVRDSRVIMARTFIFHCHKDSHQLQHNKTTNNHSIDRRLWKGIISGLWSIDHSFRFRWQPWMRWKTTWMMQSCSEALQLRWCSNMLGMLQWKKKRTYQCICSMISSGSSRFVLMHRRNGSFSCIEIGIWVWWFLPLHGGWRLQWPVWMGRRLGRRMWRRRRIYRWNDGWGDTCCCAGLYTVVRCGQWCCFQ